MNRYIHLVLITISALFMVILLLVGAGNLTPAYSAGTTIRVPDDYTTIQAAINAASDGDTIMVKSDTYNENLTISEGITLTGGWDGTFSTRIPGDSVIDGQKTWTTGGHRAEFMFCLARTDPESKRGKGLSLFHVAMNSPGIEIRPLKYMDGAHVYNEVFFNDVRVPAKDLIGEEGIGWGLTRQTMNFERSNVGGFAAVKRKIEKLSIKNMGDDHEL